MSRFYFSCSCVLFKLHSIDVFYKFSTEGIAVRRAGACVCAKLPQSCLTLCNPLHCSPPGLSVHRLLQARILEWVAMPSSGGSNSHLLYLLHRSKSKWWVSGGYRQVELGHWVIITLGWDNSPSSETDRKWMLLAWAWRSADPFKGNDS